MSSAAEHQSVTLACSAVAAIFQQCPDDERLILGLSLVGGGILGAKLPDILEPATSSHHRAFCHSLVALGGVAWAIRKILDYPRETAGQRLFRAVALGVLMGYASHLLLDARTPRSIPLM